MYENRVRNIRTSCFAAINIGILFISPNYLLFGSIGWTFEITLKPTGQRTQRVIYGFNQ